MPRDPKIPAKRRFNQAWQNHKRSRELVETTRGRLNEAIVAAVHAGIPRNELAKHMNVSTTFVSQTPGLSPAWVKTKKT